MDELEYDVVIYGTGLVSSLVASSLIKRLNYPFDGDSEKNNSRDTKKNKENKSDSNFKKVRVLNVDKYGDYGSDYRTLTFKQLLSLENSQLVNSHNDLYNIKLNVIKQYLNFSKSPEDDGIKSNKDNILYYDFFPFHQTFDKLTNSDFLTEKDYLEGNYVNEDKNNKKEEDKERHLEVEEKVKDLFENSNLYNIDLYPRLILNNSLFLKYLINSNIYKQLQLCTNNTSNVLYLFENKIQQMEEDEVDKEDKENDKKDNSIEERNKDVKKKYEELMYDKNTIFRSNFLTNAEKRLLFIFLFHPKSVRSFDVEGKEERYNKNNEKKLLEDDKKKRQEDDNLNKEMVKDYTNKTFEEYLRESGLTYKLMNLINYGMCFNQKRLSDENPANLYEEMYKLNQYIKAYGFGRDTKGINDVKNCFVYSLYGLSNLVQFVCRLNSLYQCHHMLNNTVLSLSVSEYNKDGQKVDVNNEDAIEERNKVDEESNEDDKVDNMKDDNMKNRILIKLNNYKVYTKYIVSEYNLTEVVEEFVPLENREQYFLTEKDYLEGNYLNEDKNNKKVLVVSVISSKKMFDSFNLCVVVPGRSDARDNKNLGSDYNITNDGNNDNTRDNSGSQQNNEKKLVEDDNNEDSMEELNENPMYVLQTCRDTLTAPEGIYVVYFMTLVEGDAYNTSVDVSNLFNDKEDDDSTECNSNDTYLEEEEKESDEDSNKDNKVDKMNEDDKVDNSSSSCNKYCKYRELKKVLSLYEYFVNDLSSIVFLSYTTYNYTNNIQLISLDDNINKLDEMKDKKGEAHVEEYRKKKFLKMVDNFYSNDNILYLSNELYVSHQVTNQLLRLYKKEEDEDKHLEVVEKEKKEELEEKVKDYTVVQKEVNLENYLKYNDEEEDDEFSINCDFLSDLIDKFF